MNKGKVVNITALGGGWMGRVGSIYSMHPRDPDSRKVALKVWTAVARVWTDFHFPELNSHRVKICVLCAIWGTHDLGGSQLYLSERETSVFDASTSSYLLLPLVWIRRESEFTLVHSSEIVSVSGTDNSLEIYDLEIEPNFECVDHPSSWSFDADARADAASRGGRGFWIDVSN